MVKKTISILIFLTALIVAFKFLDASFATKNYFNNTIADFNEQINAQPQDVLIFGSSHAFTAFNPAVIDKLSKTHSFNLGSDGLTLPFTKMVMQKALKQMNPSLVIIEVYPSALKGPMNDQSRGYQLRVLDKTSNLSLEKFTKVLKYYDSNEIPGVYSTMIRNHAKWHEMDLTDLENLETIETRSTYYYKGYRGRTLVIDTVAKPFFNDFRSREDYLKSEAQIVDEKANNELIDLIRLAKSKAQYVLLISAPDLRAKYHWDKSFSDALEAIAEHHEINYLDLNTKYDEMDLRVADFRDQSHLNVKGAFKASKFLSNYINENYSLNPIEFEAHEEAIYTSFLDDYIELRERFFKTAVDGELTQNIVPVSLEAIKKGKTIHFTLAFDQEKIAQSKALDYKLLVKLIPVEAEESLVDPSFSKRGWNYDKADIAITELKELNFSISTNIENFERIELSLYNKEKYQGVVGKRIKINEITFE